MPDAFIPEPLPPDTVEHPPPPPLIPRLTVEEAKALGVNVTVATFVHLQPKRGRAWLMRVSCGHNRTVRFLQAKASGLQDHPDILPDASDVSHDTQRTFESILRLEPGFIPLDLTGWKAVVEMWAQDIGINLGGMGYEEKYFPKGGRVWTARR